MDNNLYITIIDRASCRHLLVVGSCITRSVADLLPQIDQGARCNCVNGHIKNCHVVIVAGMEKIETPEEKESQLLRRMPRVTASSRLACQIMIKERLNGIILALD